MRLMIIAGMALAALSIAPGPAHAAPPGQLGIHAGNNFTLIADGCGPRRFRARNGYCYAQRPPPRRFERRCPRGSHPTPYGCRRNH